MADRERAALALADGTVFYGRPFGARGKTTGEVVFCTAMSGYQEILTDPSYHRQLVVMTAPEIGNVGVNRADAESRKAFAAGFVIKDPSPLASSWRAETTLPAYLEAEGVVGISGIDTRALTRRIRDGGAQMGVLASGDIDPAALSAEAKSAPPNESRDLVLEVSTPAAYDWDEGTLSFDGAAPPPAKRKIAVYDFGVKRQTLRMLRDRGSAVRVFPAAAPPREIAAWGAEGLLLSNGPGDPARATYAISAVRELLGKLPVFGICLGHQILALALGAKTRKMRFGHRGANQPVASAGRVVITSQNHGFEVDPDSPFEGLVTERNLSDGSVEGLAAERLSAFSVQYHPEASPGPHDAAPLFDRFLAAVDRRR
jgi:carbamoyl-phosphate synthase small subunit